MGWWWAVVAAVVVLVVAYLCWLGARVGRLHRRAETAAAALDASLVRRAAAAAVLADQLAGRLPRASSDLYVVARAALDSEPQEREVAENDLTRTLRLLPGDLSAEPAAAGTEVLAEVAAWPNVVTASRRLGLARQVHTDVVRDARAVRRRIPVRLLGLARRFPEPGYFDIDDPGMDGHPAAGLAAVG